MGYSKRFFQKYNSEGRDFLQLAEGILERCDLADFTLFVQIARQVWLQRNRWVYDGIFKHPKSIIQETAMHMEEFNLIHDRVEPD